MAKIWASVEGSDAMKVIVVKDYQELSKRASFMIAAQVTLKPNSVLGLATGSTPVGTYEALVKLYQEGFVDFTKVKTFNLDEYYHLGPDNPQSYRFFMENHLFSKVNIPKEAIEIPRGLAQDVEAECRRYEEAIQAAGGIDFQLLGIGVNGHIGFNEPDVKFEAQTHLVALDQETIRSNARFFHSIEAVPKHALSMGIKTIMQSRHILLLASGLEKAETVHQMLKGKITPATPATILQLHPNVTILLDEAAASACAL